MWYLLTHRPGMIWTWSPSLSSGVSLRTAGFSVPKHLNAWLHYVAFHWTSVICCIALLDETVPQVFKSHGAATLPNWIWNWSAHSSEHLRQHTPTVCPPNSLKMFKTCSSHTQVVFDRTMPPKYTKISYMWILCCHGLPYACLCVKSARLTTLDTECTWMHWG